MKTRTVNYNRNGRVVQTVKVNKFQFSYAHAVLTLSGLAIVAISMVLGNMF